MGYCAILLQLPLISWGGFSRSAPGIHGSGWVNLGPSRLGCDPSGPPEPDQQAYSNNSWGPTLDRHLLVVKWAIVWQGTIDEKENNLIEMIYKFIIINTV